MKKKGRNLARRCACHTGLPRVGCAYIPIENIYLSTNFGNFLDGEEIEDFILEVLGGEWLQHLREVSTE